MSVLVVFVAFWSLLALTWFRQRAQLLARDAADWWIDLSGLLVQGALVPLGQWALATWAWPVIAPAWHGVWSLPSALTFLLNFVAVDYLYYWNHRLLHARVLWRFHAVHHTAPAMDVVVTSRNTLFTPLLIVYFWVNGLLMYLLADPAPFALAAAVTAALDLWRHSTIAPPRGSVWHRGMAVALITPHEHAWHHSREVVQVNFGANLSIWDRLHGTYRPGLGAPDRLGVDHVGSVWTQLFLPAAAP